MTKFDIVELAEYALRQKRAIFWRDAIRIVWSR